MLFVCDKEQLSKKVIKKSHFNTIEEMVKEIQVRDIMPTVKSIEEMKKMNEDFANMNEVYTSGKREIYKVW